MWRHWAAASQSGALWKCTDHRCPAALCQLQCAVRRVDAIVGCWQLMPVQWPVPKMSFWKLCPSTDDPRSSSTASHWQLKSLRFEVDSQRKKSGTISASQRMAACIGASIHRRKQPNSNLQTNQRPFTRFSNVSPSSFFYFPPISSRSGLSVESESCS